MLRKLLSTTALFSGALLLLSAMASTARADVPYVEQVPAKASMVLGVTDTAATWQKTEALPLATAIEQFLQTPRIAQDVNYQQFQLEREKLAQQLGYPATFDEFMGNIFRDFVIFGLQETYGSPQPTVVAIIGIKDKAKAARFIEVMDERYQQAAEKTAGTTPTLSQPTVNFEQIQIEENQVSHITRQMSPGTAPTSAFYSLVDDRLVYATSRQAIDQVISGGELAGGNLKSLDDYQRLQKMLPWGEAEMVGWINADAISAGLPMVQMMANIPGVPEKNRAAFTGKVQPDGVNLIVASTADPAQMSEKITPGQMQGLNYIVQQPLVAVATRAFDPQLSYQQFQAFMANPMFGGLGGANPIAQFESAFGISIPDELLPALGNEFSFAVNQVQLNPMAPMLSQADLVVGVDVASAERMKAILQKVERKIEADFAAPPQPGMEEGAATGPKFTSVDAAGTEIRTLNFGFPSFTPSYAIHDDYLLIGITLNGVQTALLRAGGSLPSVRQSAAYQEVTEWAGSESGYDFSLVDFQRMIQTVVMPVMPMILSSQPMENQQMATQLVNQVLMRLSYGASMTTQRDGASLAYIKMKMQ